MRAPLVLAVFCALALSACTSMRVSGFVTDGRTGEPIGTCGVTVGPGYGHTDSAGHYVVNAKRGLKTMQFIAPGYQTLTVPVDSSTNRYPVVNVQLTPKKSAKEP